MYVYIIIAFGYETMGIFGTYLEPQDALKRAEEVWEGRDESGSDPLTSYEVRKYPIGPVNPDEGYEVVWEKSDK